MFFDDEEEKLEEARYEEIQTNIQNWEIVKNPE